MLSSWVIWTLKVCAWTKERENCWFIWRKSTISNVYRPKYTRVTPTTKTLIEVLLPNKPDYFRPSGIINASLSDHFMIHGIMHTKMTRMRKLVPEKAKRLFKSLILLGLNYCSIVWLFIRAFGKRKLEQINATPDARQCLRAAFNDNTLSYESLLKKAALLTFYITEDCKIWQFWSFKLRMEGLQIIFSAELFQRSDTVTIIYVILTL